MKKLIFIILITIFSISSIYAENVIARFEFTGSGVEDNPVIGAEYSKKIGSELRSLGYEFVSRDKELKKILEEEVKLQKAYNRKDYINAAVQVNADFALIGTINLISDKYSVSVSLINLLTLKEITVSKTISSLIDTQEADDAIVDIAGEINAKIYRREIYCSC